MAEEFDFADSFDPSSFVSSSPLNGKRAVVIAAKVKQTNFGNPSNGMSTVIDIQVAGGDLEKRRFLKSIRCGNLYPATKDAVTGKLMKAESGAYMVGGSLDKKSNGSDFFTALTTSGFPKGLTSQKGIEALLGAEITWKCHAKTIQKVEYTYDIPGQFHGFVDAKVLADLQASVGSEATAMEAPATSVAPVAANALSDDEIVKALGDAVKAALVEANGPIPRGQLGIRVGPKMTAIPVQQRGTALGMLSKNEFYAKVDGLEYDAKEVKLKATVTA